MSQFFKRILNYLSVPLLCAGLSSALPAQEVALAPESKIIGGEKAPGGVSPFMVAMLDALESDPFLAQYCGGVLIAPNWILTAGHCLAYEEEGNLIYIRPDEIQVAVGIDNLLSIQQTDRLEVDAIFVHPGYREADFHDDLALIRLKESVRGKESIPFYDEVSPSLGEMVRALGWGVSEISSSGTAYFPYELRQIDLPIASTFNFGFLDPDEVVAGSANPSRDTCGGDSGGPLIYQVDGEWQLVGLTSYGSACGQDDSYGVYTSVYYHANWIREIMEQNSPATVKFDNLNQLNNLWFQSDWLGYFNATHYPWLYHQELDWLYLSAESEDNMWVYSSSLGWLYTTQTDFPHLYSHDRNSWIYYQPDSGKSEAAWFYDHTARQWFTGGWE